MRRFIHDSGTNHPMSAAAYQEDARALLAKLETKERARLGSAREAREVIALKTRAAPGTLENLRRGRLKRVEGWLRERFVELLIRETEREMRTLQHELAIYRQIGARADSDEISAVETDIARVAAALVKMKGPQE